MRKTRYAHILLLIVGIIYGVNYSVGKMVTPEYLPALGLVVVRASIACILFWVYHGLFVKEKVQHRRDYWFFLRSAIFGVAANQLLFFKGLSLTSPINASVIMTANPVIVLGLSAIILKEALTWKKIAGMAIGFTGALLLISKGEISFSSDTFVGDLMILGNATSYGLYLIFVKPLMARYQPETVVKWIFLMGLPFIWIVGGNEFFSIDWSTLPTQAWLGLSYIIIGTTFFAYLLNAKALQYVTSSLVGYYIYLQPVIASLVAISIGQDTLTWTTVGCTTLIFFGVFLVSQPTAKSKVRV
ncbi:MAG: DMT family transporter [Bacteroidota bacterium]